MGVQDFLPTIPIENKGVHIFYIHFLTFRRELRNPFSYKH